MLMGLSLLLASISWAGFVLSSTVLDPGGSTRLVSETMNHDTVQSVLTGRLADGLVQIVPESEPVSRQEAEKAAAEALTDPKARGAVAQALVEAHLLGLQGGTRDDFFSALDVNVAGREALVSAKPALRRQILANPLIKVRLPVSGLNWLAGLRNLVDRFAVLAASVALIGFATTFVVARDPELVIRRATWWILGSAGAWTLSGLIYETTARAVVPSSYAVLAVAIERFFAAMHGPSVVMLSFGLGLLSMSFLVPALRQRRGAALLADAAERNLGQPALPRRSTLVATTAVTTGAVGADQEADDGSPHSGEPAEEVPVTGSVGPGVARRMSAAWLEGHGYLDDSRVAPFFTNGSADSAMPSRRWGSTIVSGPPDSPS